MKKYVKMLIAVIAGIIIGGGKCFFNMSKK